MHYHAVLKNVRVVAKNKCAFGEIYDDKKGRFTDGTLVRTSTVQDIIESGRKTYIKTLNTTYLVESWTE